MPSGKRNFPNAELVLHAKELRHWFDDAAMSRADEQTQSLNFRAGREQVAPYAKQTRLFEQGEVFPGVTAIVSPGHTPGHTVYLVASQTDQLMIWGDTVHVPEIQTAFPDATMVFDTDRIAAAEARKRLFDRIASENMLVAGMHLNFPSFGRLVRRAESGYRLCPEASTCDI